MGLSWFQPAYSFPEAGPAPHPDGEPSHRDQHQGSHTGGVAELSPSSLCFLFPKGKLRRYCDSSVFCVTVLHQKSHGTWNTLQ